jgi:hypothetical protein
MPRSEAPHVVQKKPEVRHRQPAINTTSNKICVTLTVTPSHKHTSCTTTVNSGCSSQCDASNPTMYQLGTFAQLVCTHTRPFIIRQLHWSKHNTELKASTQNQKEILQIHPDKTLEDKPAAAQLKTRLFC